MIHASRELMMHRLSEAEGDEELAYALDRLRRNFYQLHEPVREYMEDPSRLERWQRAEKHSQGWRKALFFEEALEVLDTALYG